MGGTVLALGSSALSCGTGQLSQLVWGVPKRARDGQLPPSQQQLAQTVFSKHPFWVTFVGILSKAVPWRDLCGFQLPLLRWSGGGGAGPHQRHPRRYFVMG